MTDALLKAAARGVRVVVLVPGEIDSRLTYTVSRSHYGPLLLGRVEIFEYQAALMHAKTMVVDGVWATVGSTNFDNRSFALNQELNLTVYDATVARRLDESLSRRFEILEENNLRRMAFSQYLRTDFRNLRLSG